MKYSTIALCLAQAACIAAAPVYESAPVDGHALWEEVAGAVADHWMNKVDNSVPSISIPELAATPTPTTTPPPPPPAATTPPPPPPPPPVAAPAPAPAPVSPAPAPVSPPSTPAPPPSSGGPSSGGKAWIDSINQYRSKAGLGQLTWDNTLAGNSQKTVNDAGGKALVHELNSGSMAQVLVFGYDDQDKCTKNTQQWTSFEIFFYSWICEVPSDPAINPNCPAIGSIGMIDSQGQTGHHTILSSTSYTKIGCAFGRDPSAAPCAQFPGVWGCDLA